MGELNDGIEPLDAEIQWVMLEADGHAHGPYCLLPSLRTRAFCPGHQSSNKARLLLSLSVLLFFASLSIDSARTLPPSLSPAFPAPSSDSSAVFAPGYLQKGKGQHTKIAMEKDGGISREEMTRAISVW